VPAGQFVSRSAAHDARDELFKGREDEILASPDYRLHVLYGARGTRVAAHARIRAFRARRSVSAWRRIANTLEPPATSRASIDRNASSTMAPRAIRPSFAGGDPRIAEPVGSLRFAFHTHDVQLTIAENLRRGAVVRVRHRSR
jgi:transposase InsO family protein